MYNFFQRKKTSSNRQNLTSKLEDAGAVLPDNEGAPFHAASSLNHFESRPAIAFFCYKSPGGWTHLLAQLLLSPHNSKGAMLANEWH